MSTVKKIHTHIMLVGTYRQYDVLYTRIIIYDLYLLQTRIVNNNNRIDFFFYKYSNNILS